MLSLTHKTNKLASAAMLPFALIGKRYLLVDYGIWKAVDWSVKKLESMPHRTDLRRRHFQGICMFGIGASLMELGLTQETIKFHLDFPIIVASALVATGGTSATSSKFMRRMATTINPFRTGILASGLYALFHPTLDSDTIMGQIGVCAAGLYYLTAGKDSEAQNTATSAKTSADSA